MAKVLVVDKDGAFLEQVKELLARAGHEALTCGEGEAALALAQEAVPALVVLGTLAGRQEAPDLCRRLKGEGGRPAVVVVDERGPGGWPADEGKAMEAEEYLCRPFEESVFLAIVDEVVQRGQPAKEVLFAQ
ncbi:MAG: response regulator transcription factor [Clostridia bacterium]|nr:response regulator transcription factor [Clostridia bacterium]MBC7347559.1 response regulator transcription factor [Clostridia bacterium]